VLSGDQRLFFARNYGLGDLRGVLWCPSLSRYVFRVYGPHGETRGWTARDLTGDLTPKCISYPNLKHATFISWYRTAAQEADNVVVVEDQLSAMKVREAGYSSVALLGVALNADRAWEIAEHSTKVMLALDRGTMPLMTKYAAEFGGLWGAVEIWSLDKDLKYVSNERIKKAVEGGKIDFISYI
jgi:hypothetical protein